VYSRFHRWQRAGVWDRALAALQADADARGDVDWTLHLLDGTTIRAHPHAAGAKKGAVIKRSAAAKAASRPKSTSGPTGAANR
jgi:transposase